MQLSKHKELNASRKLNALRGSGVLTLSTYYNGTRYPRIYVSVSEVSIEVIITMLSQS